MKQLDTLMNVCPYEQILITDTKMIEYFTGNFFDVGERFIGLIVRDGLKPVLILNTLFKKPSNIITHYYSDGENITSILTNYFKSNTLAVDGTMNASFLIPLIQDYTIIDGSQYLHQCRNIKNVHEQALMIEASRLNDLCMASLIKQIKIGMSEIEVANIARTLQSTHPISGPSFDPIVLFGDNSWDPHGVPSDRKLKENDIILIDMGGMVNGYASDMTRCFFTGHHETLEKIYAIVLEANIKAIEAVKTGRPLSEVDKAARGVIDEAGYGANFVHRTGHGIGMETHEFLDVSSSNETLIEDGMCFSIEPGIYIEGLGGVRIEDLILVENGKAKVINHYPKDLQIIKV